MTFPYIEALSPWQQMLQFATQNNHFTERASFASFLKYKNEVAALFEIPLNNLNENTSQNTGGISGLTLAKFFIEDLEKLRLTQAPLDEALHTLQLSAVVVENAVVCDYCAAQVLAEWKSASVDVEALA